ncbi:glycosyltransferase family 4 protein [Candidatus Saganbacteria bacterium]|nr:glycosyltransferase family 4 protein [Candidatus Saganbacteria bacterium]
MRETKVLFIWHAAVVETYQKYIAELAEHNDLEITLLMPKGNVEGSRYVEAFIPKNAKYKIIVGYLFYPKDILIGFYPLLPYYLFKVKPDIIHMFEEPWHNIAAYMDLWSSIICPKAKLIFQTFQNQVEEYQKSWIRTQNWTFKRSSAAIACAEEMKDVLLHWGYKKPIHVVYPGIETKLFSPQDPARIKDKLGLKEFTIGYFGRMIKEKGIEDLIAACKKLAFHYKLMFIGNGPDREYFKSIAQNATFIDAVTPNEINEYYSALDVFVLPSRTTKNWKEQFGRVLVEAMLCGVPVIGSSSGEIPKVIGNAGLVFKEKDPNDLALKITSIRQDPGLARSLTTNGLSRGKIFDWKIVADKVYEAYKSLS